MKENLNCDFSLIQLEYLIYSFIHYMLTEKWRDRQIHDISIFICKVKKSVYCKKVGGQPPPLPMIRKACSGVFSGSHIGLDHYSMRKNYELDMLLQKSCFTIHTTAKILIRWFEWTHQSIGTDLWGRGGGFKWIFLFCKNFKYYTLDRMFYKKCIEWTHTWLYSNCLMHSTRVMYPFKDEWNITIDR